MDSTFRVAVGCKGKATTPQEPNARSQDDRRYLSRIISEVVAGCPKGGSVSVHEGGRPPKKSLMIGAAYQSCFSGDFKVQPCSTLPALRPVSFPRANLV
jgi:hypothetical protein